MKFFKNSKDNGCFYLLQCLVKGNAVQESGVKFSFEDKEIKEDELLLLINIDIKKNHLKCLKDVVKCNYAIPDLLVIYGKIKNHSIFNNFVVIDLGYHNDSELENKKQGAKILFKELGLEISSFTMLNLVRGASHTKASKQYKRLRPNDTAKIFKVIRNELN
jgi:hypothetical protein